MARSVFGCTAAIIAVALSLPATFRAFAQEQVSAIEFQELQKTSLRLRCKVVALESTVPYLPAAEVLSRLSARPDFLRSKLKLTPKLKDADVAVYIKLTTLDQPQIYAYNTQTGAYITASIPFVDLPGVIAGDVMDSVAAVCPKLREPNWDNSLASAFLPVVTFRPPVACTPAPPLLKSASSLSACAFTSWMDDSEADHALRSRPEITQMGIQMRKACDTADAMLSIRHSLEVLTEWSWQLASPEHERLSSGQVIAFSSKQAAARIADAVLRDLQAARGISEQGVSAEEARRAKNRANIKPRTIHLRMVSTNPAAPDQAAVLSVDNEQIKGLSEHGETLFQFPIEEIRDVRIRTFWNSPTLDVPTDLVDTFENTSDPYEFMVAGGFLTAYTGLALILSQLRTSSTLVELVWEDETRIQTVTLSTSRSQASLLNPLKNVVPSPDSTICNASETH